MSRLFLHSLLVHISAAFTAAVGAEVVLPEKVQFNRDVRPILSENCFYCHGPDSATREAGLRLDVREEAIKGGAIVPGEPGKGSLMERIHAHDEDDLMPPAKSNRHLTEADKALLKRWIEQGAGYEVHWSFAPLQPTAPAGAVGNQGNNVVDQMVAEGLKARGLAIQPEASRETLIRRLSFDLTGLPPTPQEVAAFVHDTRQDAYPRLVDRLLQSPHYGERMAVDWLDVSRYADSHGFQVDREREVWPWRDWVIRAFNDNLPFDQFVTWQIAGDLLPNPTDDQVLATAFNRLHQQESEGGSVEEEYRVEYVADRVQTFSTAFLGLTMECARCHDHKYDPITHRDYYSLFAFFQNIDEAGLYSFFTSSQPTPAMVLSDASSKQRLQTAGATVAKLEQELRQRLQTRQTGPVPAVAPAIRGEIARYPFDSLEKGKSPDGVKGGKPAVIRGANSLVAGRVGQAVQFTGDDAVDLAVGNFRREEPFSVSLWLQVPDRKDRAVVFHRSRAASDAASRGYELLIEEGRLKWSLIHFWPGNAISVRTRAEIPLETWTHVTVSYDGSSRASGLVVYVNGQPANLEVIKDGLGKEITGGGHDHISLGERFRDRGFKGGRVDEVRIFKVAVTPAEARWLHDGKATITPAEWAAHQAAVAGEGVAKLRQELQSARQEWYRLQDAAREIMVMQELPEPKKAYVLFRGEYNQRREEVTAATPSALPPMAPDLPRNRLGLARWLTARENPLLARVTVNRVWQGLFGRGLVKTAEDFGSQGERPLQPELLDWLALHFMDSGWDMKALMRTIVLSRTYRQRSMADPAIMADDPENQWLARGPRHRLPAEMIRDNALAASGLLNPVVGGPPVNPYEMQEAFKPVSPSGGAAVYRRSLYTAWRRTSPPPAMVAFDAPRRAVCSAKRERTDSPLQALILLNGTQYVEAARVLGEKLHREAQGDPARMVEGAFLACLSRQPDARERQITLRLHREQLAHYQQHPREAAALLKVGQAPHDGKIPLPELAAAAILAQTLMNHDASVVKR